MKAICKTLLCIACLLMTFNVMGRELERHQSDSVSHALATMWSASYHNISTNDGKEVATEFMRGVQDALSLTKAEGEKAYQTGWEQGQQMLQIIKDIETRGKFKVDVPKIQYVFKLIEKGRTPGFTNETAQRFLNWLIKKIAEEDYRVEGSAEYLSKAAQREGVIKTSSGLLFEVLKEGEGDCPDSNDMVCVKYEGRLIDGKVVSISDQQNNSILHVGETIPGFAEGLQMMKIGGKYRLYIPSEIGYGEGGSENIPGGAASIFDVELIDYCKVDADGKFGKSVLVEKKLKEQNEKEEQKK